MKNVYLDHAAATPLDPEIKKAMDGFWDLDYGNARGLYREGRRAREAIEDARAEIAKIIQAQPDEIIFTSGGTESDNLAIFGVAGAVKLESERASFPEPQAQVLQDLAQSRHGGTSRAIRQQADMRVLEKPAIEAIKPHIITTKFEHPAVLNPCKELAKAGFDVTYLDVGEDGVVGPQDVKEALRPETILVSVMHANNEIGTIQPLTEIGKIIKEYRIKKSERFDKNYP